MTELENARHRLTSAKAEQAVLQDQLAVRQDELHGLKIILEHREHARVIIQEVALATQNNLVFHISSLVTMALQSVFDDSIELVVEFRSQRGKTECLLQFKDAKGNLMRPTEASGGGALDVASFALRCAFWSLKKTRHTLVLDEPFKFLSRDLIPKAAEMVQMISKELNLQIIMVSHIPDFIDSADKVFVVSQTMGESSVALA